MEMPEQTSSPDQQEPFRCRTPVLLLIFNRPEITRRTIEAVRAVRPTELYVAADGPRRYVDGEEALTAETRRTVMDAIDWPCQVTTLLRDENLGCKTAVSEAITWFLDQAGEGIILEDDCLPTVEFFAFCEWGLSRFRGDDRVGSVSGSNLVADQESLPTRNGFSIYMNPWGWATWQRAWRRYTGVITDAELDQVMRVLEDDMELSWWQVRYWMTQFRHMRGSDSIWDMYLQFAFFKHRLVSVYPRTNLVRNIGYGGDGTHTTDRVPGFVRRTLPPHGGTDIMSHPANTEPRPVAARDDRLAATIWRCTPLGTLRFVLGSLYRRVS